MYLQPKKTRYGPRANVVQCAVMHYNNFLKSSDINDNDIVVKDILFMSHIRHVKLSYLVAC